MTTVVTKDKKSLVLTEDFETRWTYAATVASDLGVSEVPISLSSSDVKVLIKFDSAMEARKRARSDYEAKIAEGKKVAAPSLPKGPLVEDLSVIQEAAALFDPVDEEWRLYANIDEAATNQREAYLRVGFFLRTTGLKHPFVVPSLPERTTSMLESDDAFTPQSTTERTRLVVMETEWISVLVGILYMIFRSIGMGTVRLHHYRSYAQYVPDAAHYLLGAGEGNILAWGQQYAPPSIFTGGTTREARYQQRKDYDIWLRMKDGSGTLHRDTILRAWYSRTDVRGRWRVADAVAGVYRPRRQYIDSPTWVVGMDPLVEEDVALTITGERGTQTTRVELVTLPQASFTIQGPEVNFFADRDLMALVLIHLFKTRDRSLSPASLGLGALILDMDPDAAEMTRKRKRTYEVPIESVSVRFLASLFLQDDRWSLIRDQLGTEVIAEIAAALIDWMLYIQRKSGQEGIEGSIDAGEPTPEELAGLLEDQTASIPVELYDAEDEEPEGDGRLHDELYAGDEEYRAISDLADEALEYL